MAIQQQMTIDVKYKANLNLTVGKEITQSLNIPNAYIMVNTLEGDKYMIYFNISVYENDTKEAVLYTRDYQFVPDLSSNSPNFIQQAYEHLKTLPEYSSATDVLEDGQML